LLFYEESEGLESVESVELSIEQERFSQFSPIFLSDFEGKKVKVLSSFNAAVDTFFKGMLVQADQQKDKEKLLQKKYNNIKEDQQGRIDKL